jgi:hypothetical protein
MLERGEYERAWKWLPEFSRAVEAEMSGRHLAMLLGVLQAAGTPFEGSIHAYGPSSGSGNYAISFGPSVSRIL